MIAASCNDPLWHCGGPVIELPPLADLQRGGIVGSVQIVDCVMQSDSPWFRGRFGFVLRDPRPLPFVPWRGSLGFFDVPASALEPAMPPHKPGPLEAA